MLFRQHRDRGTPQGRRDRRGNMPSMLGADVKVEGDVVTEGDLFIGGSIKGRVVAHKVTIAENASLTGLVEADTVIIAGTLTGKLTANTVTLKRTANVSGDITHVQLTIETGSCFDGYSHRVASVDITSAHVESEQVGKVAMPALTHAEAHA